MLGALARAHAAASAARSRSPASARGVAGVPGRDDAFRRPEGRLNATLPRRPAPRLNGYLDDYAFVGRGLVDLYEADFDPSHLVAAEQLAETMLTHFEDREHGGFYFTADDHEKLLVRNRSSHDSATPAGAGVAIELLTRLSIHRDRDDLREAAGRALRSVQAAVARMPSAHVTLLLAANWSHTPPPEVAVLGPPDDSRTALLIDTVRRLCGPRAIVQSAAPGAAREGLALCATGHRWHTPID